MHKAKKVKHCVENSAKTYCALFPRLEINSVKELFDFIEAQQLCYAYAGHPKTSQRRQVILFHRQTED
jgi:hypothetical protein